MMTLIITVMGDQVVTVPMHKCTHFSFLCAQAAMPSSLDPRDLAMDRVQVLCILRREPAGHVMSHDL